MEADSGYFHGEIANSVFTASTDNLYGTNFSYSNTDIRDICNQMKNLFNSDSFIWETDRLCSGTKSDSSGNSKPLKKIRFYFWKPANESDLGHALATITFTYTNGTTEEIKNTEGNNYQQKTIYRLDFAFMVEVWNVSMKNIPTRDPKVAGVLWRDGTDVKISLG